tara:strand:+ start:118 stop:513 length:396 start_codon:yes stop_codon:yes gene_type:complete
VLKKYLKKNKLQIIKFILVGLTSAVISFGTYSLIYIFTSRINIASFLGYVAGMSNSFLFARNWVFINSRKIRIDKALVIFCLIYIVGGLEMTIVVYCVDLLIENYKIAWFIGAIIAACSNYLGSKYLLFKS